MPTLDQGVRLFLAASHTLGGLMTGYRLLDGQAAYLSQ